MPKVSGCELGVQASGLEGVSFNGEKTFWGLDIHIYIYIHI